MTSKTPITDANVFPKDEFPSDVVVHPSVARDLEEKLTDTQADLSECRRKLAEAGVEGSPPPGSQGTIQEILKRAHDAEAKLARAVKLLQESGFVITENKSHPFQMKFICYWCGESLPSHNTDCPYGQFLASLEEGPWTKPDPATFIGIDPGKEDK